jgi:hypothetical protein
MAMVIEAVPNPRQSAQDTIEDWRRARGPVNARRRSSLADRAGAVDDERRRHCRKRVGATLPVTPIPALRRRFSAPPDRVKGPVAGVAPLTLEKSITY